MYSFDGKDWGKVYDKSLSKEDKEKILDAFNKVYGEVNFLPKEHYGNVLEDRESQFTFSALGQNAPVDLKKQWDIDVIKRQELKRRLDKYLPGFAVEIGGLTSIDVTQKSIDKGFAIEQIKEILNIKTADILFIGDAIFEGGNDYSAVRTGVDYINVNNYNETKGIIRNIISEKNNL